MSSSTNLILKNLVSCLSSIVNVTSSSLGLRELGSFLINLTFTLPMVLPSFSAFLTIFSKYTFLFYCFGTGCGVYVRFGLCCCFACQCLLAMLSVMVMFWVFIPLLVTLLSLSLSNPKPTDLLTLLLGRPSLFFHCHPICLSHLRRHLLLGRWHRIRSGCEYLYR